MFLAAVVAAASIGRFTGMMLLAALPTIPERASLGRDLTSLPRGRVLGAVVAVSPAVAFLASVDAGAAGAAVALCFVIVVFAARYLKRRIGGSTGDALGAATYAAQLTTLLAALWQA